MKEFKQPLLTIIIIFATAYILSLIGCAPSGDKTVGAPSPAAGSASTPTTESNSGNNPSGPVSDVKLVQVDAAKMRDCRDNEFQALQAWGSVLSASDAAIKAMGDKSTAWKKKDDVIKLAQAAIVQCDQLQTYHLQNPCKKVVDKNIVNPTGTAKAYDAFRIHQRCDLSNKYLVQFNARPAATVKQPTPIQPPAVTVQPTTPVAPLQPPVAIDPNANTDMQARDMHECNEAEFAKIKPWRAALDQANKSISKLGSQSSWKYEVNAIDFSKTATLMCESLIAYHQTQPCKRFVKDDKTGVTTTKIYSGDSLREQCTTARTYQYEFRQQDTSLMLTNARLYFDTSIIAGKTVNSGYVSDVKYGQCIFSNNTSNPITYNSEKALVTAARVYPGNDPEGTKMFVLETAEGLKMECYGLDFQSAKTSKNEVVRLLKEKQTNISLTYELN